MKHAPPAPPELGTRDGLAYALFVPEGEPRAGVVICHGAGSAKESHFDFARGCRDDGMAAIAFDARGHGRSEGVFGPSAIDDALKILDLMAAYAPRLALRGSSMGGFVALHAAARDREVCAVVAICPAPEDMLLRAVRSQAPERFACDVPATERWLRSVDVYEAAADLDEGTALLLMHARGDEQIPHAVSEQLFQAAHEPKRLLVLPGGHHRSLQHDMELQAVSRRFIQDAAGRH
ncbi:MAG: alpha/beta fold hydrolase [Thermoleophilaceae bacterium]|nr:alpha/beta fold hydrolase [Thermoleophilaceae bacterium]